MKLQFIKNHLSIFQYDWPFFAIFIILLISLLLEFHWINLIMFFYILFKIIQLSLNHAKLIIVLLICFSFRSYFILSRYPELPLDYGTYTVVVDPNHLKHSDKFISGKADLLINNEAISIHFICQEPALFALNKVSKLQVNGELTSIASSRNFGTFDFKEYLSRHNIFYQLNIEEIIHKSTSRSWSSFHLNLKFNIKSIYLKFMHIEWIRFVSQLLIGQRDYRQFELNAKMQKIGIIHLFSLSGVHIYFIKRRFEYCLKRCGIYIHIVERITLILFFFMLWFSETHIGLIKITGLQILNLFIFKYDLPLSRLDKLSILAMILLFYRPYYIFELGFQLSFLITFVISYYNIHHTGSFKKKIIKKLVTHTVCFTLSLPIILYHYGSFHLFQIGFQIICLPILTFIILPSGIITLCLIYLPLIPFHFKEFLFLRMNDLFLYIIQMSDNLLKEIYLYQIMIQPKNYIIAIFLLLIVIYGLYLVVHHRILLWMALIIGLIIFLYVIPYLNPYEKLTIIDIGQGDALIYQPSFSREIWMIDTGGRVNWNNKKYMVDDSFANKQLLPALYGLGIHKIDHLIITHEDIDHIGNLKVLYETIPISNLYMTQTASESLLLKDLTPSQIISPNTHYQFKNISLFCLDGKDANDQSIVTIIKMYNQTFLNLGDLSSNAEIELLHRFPLPKIDILKVAHHGSNSSTSEELLSQLTPKIALISSGKNNRYGHPHQEVIERLKKYEVLTYLTSESGAIQVKISPIKSLQINLCLTEE